MSFADVLNVEQKRQLVTSYFDRYLPGVVIETGLWMGEGSCLHLTDRARVIALDIQQANCDDARRRHPGLETLCGDSGEGLPDVLDSVHEPALFWLDAHWVDEQPVEHATPLLAELDAILAWPHRAASVVLIDDARLIGSEGWPEMDAVSARLGPWITSRADDVIRCVPR